MFNENYDRTLWLMLVSDKTGRERLVSLIRDIPSECYSEICKMIDKYDETGTLQSVSTVKTFNAGLNRLCFDAHIFDDGELSLMVRKYTTEDKVTKASEFLLHLMPITNEYLEKLPIVSSSRYIGEIRDIKRNVVADTITGYDDSIFEISYEKKFDLRRTPAGYFVGVDSDCLIEPQNLIKDSEKHARHRKRISVSRIPEKIYVHQFENEKRVNRLVRGKKRSIISGK